MFALNSNVLTAISIIKCIRLISKIDSRSPYEASTHTMIDIWWKNASNFIWIVTYSSLVSLCLISLIWPQSAFIWLHVSSWVICSSCSTFSEITFSHVVHYWPILNLISGNLLLLSITFLQNNQHLP